MANNEFDIASLLGKDISSPECMAALSALDPKTGAKPERDSTEIRWISKQAGVELRADAKSKRIKAIFLYAGRSSFKRYPGSLPYGINFDMKSPAVKKAFPSPPSGSDSECDSWEEESRQLMVTYDDDGQITDVYLTSDF